MSNNTFAFFCLSFIISLFCMIVTSVSLYAQVDSAARITCAATDIRETAEVVLPAQIVVIDPGHGGQDAGIVRVGFEKEKDFVLQIALEIRKKMRYQSGIKVFLTRDRDMTMAVLERVALANKQAADVFVSLHQVFAGALDQGTVLRIYYNRLVADPEMERIREKHLNAGAKVLPWDLGQNSQRLQSKRLGIYVRKAWEEKHTVSSGDEQSGYPVSVPLAVLRGIQAPAIMVEIPFMPEEQVLQGDEKADRVLQEEIAGRITAGILRFLANR